MAMRLKTGVEPIWFEIMPCASFYSVLRNTPEVSRMFQRNLEYTKMTMRLKTGVEPMWFEVMPCASFYSVLRNTLEVSRMFHRNLEYTLTFYNKT